MVLLVGGGLLLRSFSRLMAVDPGFRAERVLTLATSLPAQAYRDAASVRGYTRLVDDLSEVPGVSAVGASTELPLGVRERRAFTLEQESPAARDLPHSVAHECVTGRYFEAVGIPLKRGRYFAASDARPSEPVAIINETFAPLLGHGGSGRAADRLGQHRVTRALDAHRGRRRRRQAGSAEYRNRSAPTRRGCRCQTR